MPDGAHHLPVRVDDAGFPFHRRRGGAGRADPDDRSAAVFSLRPFDLLSDLGEDDA